MNRLKKTRSSSRLGIRVIARAVAVLDSLRQHPRGLSLGEIAKLVGLPRSTVQRIVAALDDEGLVIAASLTDGVRLGPRLISLAASAKFDIADFCRSTLQRLAKETGETIDLSVLNHDKLVFVDHVPGTHRLRAVSAVGVSFPLHSNAPGKAMLAALPETELEKFRKRLSLVKLTDNTILSWKKLNRELAQVRKQGVAYDFEENSLGICAVGAVLRDPTGELAAISIPVPTQRFGPNERNLTRILQKTCQELQTRLQHKSTPSRR